MNDITRLKEIMAQLRDPKSGCPWDLKQTFQSIIPHTLEEAYEVAEAIEQSDYHGLRDELGDLLFQVIFYSQLAKEQQLFDFDDVVTAICEKMLRRHPHVFDQQFAGETDEQSLHRRWDSIKAQEKTLDEDSSTPASILDNITRTLPAMTLANKIQKKVAKVGFDWENLTQVVDKIEEEIQEVKEELDKPERVANLHDEIGDLMFACVNLARKSGADPEQLLRQANRKFEHRFRDVEQQVAVQNLKLEQLPLSELEAFWQRAKEHTKNDGI